MKKLYLVGPITGVENYKQRFENCAVKLRELIGYDSRDEIINPAFLGDILPSDASHEEIMNVCFSVLEMCDAIILLPGWEESRGANQEYGYARAKGKEIFIWEELF